MEIDRKTSKSNPPGTPLSAASPAMRSVNGGTLLSEDPGLSSSSVSPITQEKNPFFAPEPASATLPLLATDDTDPMTKALAVPKPHRYFGVFDASLVQALAMHTMFFALALVIWLVTFVVRVHLLWLMAVAYLFAHYWQGQREKLVRSLRLEASYYASQRGVQLAAEEANWFNVLLSRFWLVYEPTLSQTIEAALDPILETVCPAFLDSMKFSTFTLGSFPPQLHNIISAQQTSQDIFDLQFDVALGHHVHNSDAEPQDLQESGGLTKEEKSSKIELIIRMRGVPITVRVESITFEGTMRVRLKLMTGSPFVKVMELWLTEPPKIGFELRPMGSFDINSLGGFRKWLDDTIQWGLNENLVYPHPLVLQLDEMMNHPSADPSAPVGVLVLRIHNAISLPNFELIGKSDPYVKVLVNGNKVAATQVINNNLNPFWEEVKYIPLRSLTETSVRLDVWDWDKVAGGKVLGYVDLDLPKIEKEGGFLATEFPLQHTDRKNRGKLRFAASFFNIPAEPNNECLSGILRVTIHGGKALETGNKLRSPYVNLMLNGEQVGRTKTKKHSNNPLWDQAFDLFVTDYKTAKLHFLVKDEPSAGLNLNKITTVVGADPSLGEIQVSVAQALKRDSKDDWFALQNGFREAKLRVTLKWSGIPLQMASANQSIGALRVRLRYCTDLKSSKCNPYIQLLASARVKAQSRRISDSANPVYNESLFTLVKDLQEKLSLHVYDYNRALKDSLLGTIDLDLTKYIKEVEGKPVPMEELHNEEFKVMQDAHKSRGSVFADISFHPKKADMEYTPEQKEICGALKINVHQIKDLPKKANVYFEVYADDPTIRLFKSALRRKTQDPIFEQSVEVFVRQVYFSTIHIFVKEDTGDGATSKAHPLIGSFETYAYDLVHQTEEKWYEMGPSQIKLSFEFTPIDFAVGDAESLSNMGLLHLEIVSGRNIPVMDVGGSCDPFCVVFLDDERVHKTATQKKTLNPNFKEKLKLPIINRNSSCLKIMVYDWDRMGENELIDSVELNLSDLKTEVQETMDLFMVEHPHSCITISYLFEPKRMDKLPTRSLTMPKVALEKLDPRNILPNNMFSLNPLQIMSGRNASQDAAMRAGNEYSSLPQLSSSDILRKVPSTDFGSNSSLCAYVNENSDKVAERGALTLTVIQATHLPAFHRSSGRADPFVKIKLVGAQGKKIKFETQAIKDVLNPLWDYTVSLPVPVGKNGPDTQEPFSARFIVMDNSKLTTTGLIGECQVDLWDVVFDLIQQNNYVSEPKGTGWIYLRNAFWMPLQLPAGSQVEVIPRLQVHFGLLLPGTYLGLSHTPKPFPEGFQPCLEETMLKNELNFPDMLSNTNSSLRNRSNSDVSDQISERKKFGLKMGFKK